MRILCGTDFTPAAGEAEEAARVIAARSGGTLRVVHVADEDAKAPPALAVPADRPETEVALLFGTPDEAIVAEADRIRADLIVVGALGRRERSRWLLGSTADRIARHANCPVLVVRAAAPFRRWTQGESPLRICVGLDTSASSDALVRELGRLAAVGPCALIGVHVYWPPEMRERLHSRGGLALGAGHPEVDAAIERELRAQIPSSAGETPMELRIVGGLGRVADHLIQVAEEVSADVDAVGSHQRVGLDRLWHGSISHGVIEGSPRNVLCVPSR
jgi:nucleotide-binding universal stress UspA family protein